ncbi:MAG: hypothetical protein ACI9DO_002863 [Reinekea sp.]
MIIRYIHTVVFLFRVPMRHHFTLTFRMAEHQPINVQEVASQISGSDFQVESQAYNGGEFSVHFMREGQHAADLLEFAKQQVISAVPSAELVSMDMSEEPPMLGVVDDITKLVVKACLEFGDADLAHAWLSKPQESLGGQIPKILMVEAEGRTAVARALREHSKS